MKEWCKAVQGDLFSFQCCICNILLVCHKGSFALLQHARTAEHKKNVTINLMPNQLCLSAVSSVESGKPSKLPMHLVSYRV